MRLLSFLSEIERTIAKGSAGSTSRWQTRRMVNFNYGLARLILTPRTPAERGGTIFLQTFTLADGSSCLKASLGWDGIEEVPVISVYSTPTLNWKREAARIGQAWLDGLKARPSYSTDTYDPPIAAAG